MDKIDIYIDANVLFKMFQYAAYAEKHFDAEIAGWGHYNNEKGIYKLAPLLSQIVSSAEVNTFPNEIINNPKYDISDMIVQWHSHVNFSTSPSGTDKELIIDCLEQFPMLISIIVNCKHEYSARLDVSKMGADHCMIKLEEPTTYEVNLIPYYDNAEVDKEVLKKLKKPKPKVPEKSSVIHYGSYPLGYKGYGSGINQITSNEIIEEFNNYEEYEPPIENTSGIGNNSVEYQQILEKAKLLEADFPAEFAVYASLNGASYIRCISTGLLALISNNGIIEINGKVSDWKEFLELTGVSTFAKYYV